MHGLFHVDRGFFTTIRALFTTPGKSIREYISGKRARYFNYFTLLLLVVTFGHILSTISTVKLTDLMGPEMNNVGSALEEWSTKYPKLFAMPTIPVYALFSFLWFRRAGLNYTEHMVMNTYKIKGEFVIAMAFTILTIFYTNLAVLRLLYNLVALASFIYSVWFFHSFFYKEGYTRSGRLFRSFMATVCLFILIGLLGFFFAGVQNGFRGIKP